MSYYFGMVARSLSAVVIIVGLFAFAHTAHAANLASEHVAPKEDKGAYLLYITAVDHLKKRNYKGAIENSLKCVELFDNSMCKLANASIVLVFLQKGGSGVRKDYSKEGKALLHNFLMAALEDTTVHKDAKAVAHGLMGVALKLKLFDDLEQFNDKDTHKLALIHHTWAARGLFRLSMVEVAGAYCYASDYEKCIAWLALAAKPYFNENGDTDAIKHLKNIKDGKSPLTNFKTPTKLDYEKARTYLDVLWKNFGVMGKVESYQQLALMAIANKDYESGYNHLMHCISEDPENHWCLILLAELYFKGQHVSKSSLVAGNFTKRAADLGNIKGMEYLGLMYMYGQAGVKKDLEMAEMWLKQAKHYGSRRASIYLEKLQKLKPSSGS